MEKLKMHTPDKTFENIAKIAELFPSCVTESHGENGKVKWAIDFDLLKQELSGNVVEGVQERYHLDWAGKREALLTANAPIAKTLRPSRAESVDFETTRNLFIEGDNLDALKLLQETYLSKVKMIYIDPPYNTGNDFIYEDDFAEDKDAYFQKSLQTDGEGNRMVANNESNGRFHSIWLSFLYPRLRLSRNLLRDDGIICISIGQDEVSNCTTIGDEIFGRENRVSICTRLMKSGGHKGRYFSPNTDYVIIYAKDIHSLGQFRGELSQDLQDKVYNQIETEGQRKGERYRSMGMFQPLDARPNQRYFVECPDGTLVIPPGTTFPLLKADKEKVLPKKGDGVWRWIPERYAQEKTKGNIIFKLSDKSPLLDANRQPAKWNIYYKIWLNDRLEEGSLPSDSFEGFENRHGAKELNELGISFDFPKPSTLVSYLLQISSVEDDDIVMDFFAGAGATAHGSFNYNVKLSKRVRTISVQLPEVVNDGNAFRAGHLTIAEICKERIRRAGKKIKAEAGLNGVNLDIGFRVLKIDSSNMKDVYYSPDTAEQGNLLDQIGNIKEDRTAEDLLFQVLVDWGIDLALPINTETIEGKTVWFVDENAIAACFEDGITEDFVKQLAKRQPLRAVFRDSGFESDNVKINVEQIFKLMSPSTEVKTI